MAAAIKTVDQDYLEDTDEHVQETVAEKEAMQKYVSTFGFEVKTNKTDLVIIVEGERLYVSSLVMELSSTVFAELIENLERDENGMFEIEIRDVNCKDFVDFLACFYPGKLHQLSDESVIRVLPVALKYHLKSVEEHCVLHLLSVINCSDTTNEMLSKCLSLGYEFNIQSVKERSFEMAVKNHNKDPNFWGALPKNKAARLDLYDAIIPALVHDKNKLEFALLCKDIPVKENNLDLTLFDDARYWSDTFLCRWPNPLEILNPTGSCTFNLWGVHLGVKVPTIQYNTRAYFSLTGSDIDKRISENYNSHVAIIYIIHNRKGRAFNSYITKQLKGLDRVDDLSKAFSSNVDDGFVVDGEFTFSVHVLLEKPWEIKKDK